MTGTDVDVAMRAIGLSWEHLDGGACDATEVKVPAFSMSCNSHACGTYAAAGDAKGKTADEVAAIVRLHVGDPNTDPATPGDSTQLRALLSA